MKQKSSAIQKKKNDRCEVFNCVLDDIKEVICNFFFILPSHTHPLSINKKKKTQKTKRWENQNKRALNKKTKEDVYKKKK